jgi:hypothetical protein
MLLQQIRNRHAKPSDPLPMGRPRHSVTHHQPELPTRRPPPSPGPAPSAAPALAIHLFRVWKEALEIGAHDKATLALERLSKLAVRPDPGSRWDWHARERCR